MADMSELLSSLLGDPENAEKLGRIAAVLGAMTGEEEGCGDSCAPQEGRRGERHDRQGCGDGQCGGACACPPPCGDPCGDSCGLDLPGLDSAALLFKAMPILHEFAQGDNDPKVQLLYALRPYLTGERRERLEDAVLLLKLSRIAGSVMELLEGR